MVGMDVILLSENRRHLTIELIILPCSHHLEHRNVKKEMRGQYRTAFLSCWELSIKNKKIIKYCIKREIY